MRFGKFISSRKYNKQHILPALERAVPFASKIYKEIEKIEDCGNAIYTAKCTNCGTNHFRAFQRCKSKFCALCNNIKSRLWVTHLVCYLEQWLTQGNYVVFANFTIKDTDSLAEGLSQLEGAWRNIQGKQYRRLFNSYFPGGFKSIEVTTGANSKQWHPHIHSIVLKRGYRKDSEFLRWAWFSSVRKVGGVCTNIPKMMAFDPYTKKQSHFATKEDYMVALVDQVREVCKYITKFDWIDEEPERVAELYNSLQGKRQYAVWGVLAQIREQVKHDLEHKTEGEMEDFCCQVCGCTKATPNKVYEAIWKDDEFFIKDYINTPPKRILTADNLDGIKHINNYISQKQINSQAKFNEFKRKEKQSEQEGFLDY